MAEQKLDEFAQLAKQKLHASIDERNAFVATLKASQGDKAGLIETLAVNPPSDNEEAVAACDEVTRLDIALNEAIKTRNALLEPIADEMLAAGKEQVDELTTKVGELDKTIKAGLKYFEDLYGPEVLTDLPERVTLRGGSKAATGGEGGRRVRGFNVWVDGELATQRDAKGKDRSNLAAGAKKMGISPSDMRDAFWQAQGTQDSAQYQDKVSFTVTVGDNSYEVICERNTTEDED